METRIEHALKLADKCWSKAMEVAPKFVEDYLSICEELLQNNTTIGGDEFKAKCDARGLTLPKSLHHNTWVCGPRVMEQLGWIKRLPYKAEPRNNHNHMEQVTMWLSTIRQRS